MLQIFFTTTFLLKLHLKILSVAIFDIFKITLNSKFEDCKLQGYETHYLSNQSKKDRPIENETS